MAYGRGRLEGRALEHANAGDLGNHVRMINSNGRVELIRTEAAKAARMYMRGRYRELKHELQDRGVVCQGGDKVAYLLEDIAASLGMQTAELNVDLLVYSRQLGAYGLLEVKWTRSSFSEAVVRAKACLPKLRQVCLQGRWRSSRKPVTTGYYGLLVASPTQWVVVTYSANSSFTASMDSSSEPIPVKKKQSGVSNWVPWRGDAPPGTPFWWPSGKKTRKRPASSDA
jgi:hypothetical protein